MSETIYTNIDPYKPKINNKFNHGGDVFNVEKEGSSLATLQQLTGFDFTDVANPQELLQIFNNAKLQGLIGQDNNGELKCYVKPGIESKLNLRQYLQVRTKEFKDRFGDRQCDSESASKVVDCNGEPLVVYHGSRKSFNSFDVSKSGSGTDPGYFGHGIYFTGDQKLAERYMKKTHDGGKLFSVFVNIKNIFEWSDKMQTVCILDKGLRNIYRPNQENHKLEVHHQWEVVEDIPFKNEIIEYYNDNYNKKITDIDSNHFEYVEEKNILGKIIKNILSEKGYGGVVALNPLSLQIEYICYDAENIKSALYNRGKFSSQTDNIYD